MIRLRILGAIELADSSGRELTAVLAQPKRFALLAYLAAANGGFVRRDTLLAMFWPELDDAHARPALNQAVRFLRKSLGSTSVLVSRGIEELAVSSTDLWCDASAFRIALQADRLAKALELYRDELLPGFHCGGAPGFDEWLERERQRLRAEAACAAQKLASRCEQAQAFAAAVSAARRAAELSSTDERAVRELLALLDRLGDRAGAIHAYDAFARRLAEEVDAAPAPETVALIEAIRSRSARDEHGPRPGRAPAAPPESRLASAPLLRRIDAAEPGPGAWDRPRGRPWPRAARAGALVATAATAIALIVLAPRRTPRSLAAAPGAPSDSTVAIAPFDVFGAGEYAFWREGLVDVLAADLDGAGPIRTVSSSLAIRRWSGRADPASAEDFGRGLRARYVVFGRIVGVGRDSLRVASTLYDVTTRSTIEALDLATSAQRMDRLADSISVRLLRALSRAGAADPDRPASFGTASGPALKEFLRGEQFYRRAMWDSALAHDMGALAIDSTFPVALSRVHRILAFDHRSGTRPDPVAWEFALRAGRHNHGLTPRESLLVLRDSIVVALQAQENDPEWWTHQRRRLAATEELTRRYPDDPTAWATYGDELSGAGVLGVTESQALGALDRAIALDSTVSPTYLDAFGLALRTRGPDAALRYAEAFLSRQPSGDDARRLRILAWIIAHPRLSPKAAGPLVDSASGWALRRAAATLTTWPDSAESGIWLAREALRRAGPGDSAAAIQTLARTLASRGHLREAFSVDPTEDEWAFAEYALGGSLPVDTVRARYARVLREARPTRPLTPRGSVHRIALMVPFMWWTATGDTASLQRSASLASRFSQQSGAPFRAGVWRYVAAAAGADLSLARRDTAGALRRFLALPDTLCPWCKYERLQTAELLAAAGRWQDAYAFTRHGLRSSVEFDGVSRVAWTLLAARAAEATGRRDEARRDYRVVADTWRFADAPLRRVAAEARLAARRFGDR